MTPSYSAPTSRVSPHMCGCECHVMWKPGLFVALSDLNQKSIWCCDDKILPPRGKSLPQNRPMSWDANEIPSCICNQSWLHSGSSWTSNEVNVTFKISVGEVRMIQTHFSCGAYSVAPSGGYVSSPEGCLCTDEHTLRIISQCFPVEPRLQTHLYNWFARGRHVAPLLHGLGWQPSTVSHRASE